MVRIISKYMHCLQNFINGTYYSCFYRKKICKIKINKIIFKIDNVPKKISGLTILSIEKEMLEEIEYKNLISQFAYQKVRKIDFK